MRSLLTLLLFLFLEASHSSDFPLEPPDTSSPRATLQSFLHYNKHAIEAYRKGNSAELVLTLFNRAERCLDLSRLSADRLDRAAFEASLLLYEVLNRSGLPDFSEVPNSDAVAESELTIWRVPHTEITIVQIKEGGHAGKFLFSSDSVDRSLSFYEAVKHLPPRPGHELDNYEDFVNRPDIHYRYQWVDDLPPWAIQQVMRNPLWKWLALGLALIAGAVLIWLVRMAGSLLDRRLEQEDHSWRIGKLISAIVLCLVPLGIEELVVHVVGMRFDAQLIVTKILFMLAFAALVYAIFALAIVVTETLIASRRIKATSIDAHFLRVVTKLLAVIVSIVVVIKAAEFLGFALTPMLAGLGIGGLAVALAARPTLENVIGGFMIFTDKPVRVGDFCRFGDEEGHVEQIGVRSTRIRKRDDTLVTVPNSDFSQMKLQNNEKRRRWLYRTTIGLRYETTPEQLRYVLAQLREMLIGHPKVSADTLFVRFKGFGAYSLDIELFAYIRTREWLIHMAIREDINLRIMDIIQKAGTGFAFPSQTAYLARDTGLDTARSKEAEATVDQWRRDKRLPFPNFDPEHEQKMEGSLDYPPTGSATGDGKS